MTPINEEKKEALVQALREGKVSVLFEKTDGTKRFMECTLKRDLSKSFSKYEHKGGKKASSNSLCVWDLDKDEWRSFSWSKLISWKKS